MSSKKSTGKPEEPVAEVFCNFCSKNKAEVGQLVEGNDAYICESCVLTSKALYEREHLKRSPKAKICDVPSPKEIMEHLNQYIVGQTEAKKILAVAVVNHYKKLNDLINRKQKNNSPYADVEIEKSNVLLLGPTGCGKTLIAQTLARFLNVPFAIGDATCLTEAGYVGEDVENLLLKLISSADGDIEMAERGILYIDEIDKIGRSGNNRSITRDVSGEGVQQALLKMLEGTIANVPPTGGRKHPEQQYLQVDTTNILFICGGTFVGIDEIIQGRVGKTKIGFFNNLSINQKDKSDWLKFVATDDVIEFGMIAELVGRLPIIASCQQLTEETLCQVLTEPKNALLKQYCKLFNMDSVELKFEDKAILEIAKAAKAKNTGARGLRGVVEAVVNPLMFDLPELDKNSIITVTSEMVLDIVKSKEAA